MVVAGQRRVWSLGRVVWFVVSAVLVGMFVAGVLWTQLVQPASDTPVVQRPVVDVSDLPVWWEANYGGASWYPLVSTPTWDGNVLTAKTTLWADEESHPAAVSVCGALSAYWLTKGPLDGSFRSVRVLDAAGNVLVSRHTVGEQCTWRR